MRRRKELVLVGKRAWLFVGACLLAAVVLAGMLGCTASPPGIDPGDDSGQDPERPIGGGTARVTGRVVDAEDPSRPIEGAFVYIPVSTSNAQRAASLRSSNYAQAYSASDGSYALEEIPDGQRTIVVEPPANSEWAPVSVTVELEPGASITIIFTLVTVELNDRIATVTVDPPDTTIATGAAQQYAATVISTSGAAITITPIWLTTGGMGTITPQGVFQAGSIEGKGTIVAVAGRHAGMTPVTVSGSGNQLPQLSLRVTPTQGAAPLGVTATATASDPDGAILSAYLDWGDGSAPFEAATYPGGLSHTYLQANTYSVTARVRDDGGAQVSSTQQVTVEPAPGGAPEVSLSATPTSGAAPLSVSFQGAGSDPDGEIVGWDLDYGDGGAHWTGAAAPAGVTHTYETGGTYQAVLTGVDGSGSSGAAAVTIEVSTPSNLPPQAELTVSPGSGEAPLTVSFTGSGSDSDGTVVEYRLDFQGDGVDDWSQSSSPDGVTYIYGAAGTYQPTFTVVDDDGATGQARTTIEVSAPNSPPGAELSVSPGSGEAPLTVSFTGSGSDSDGTVVEYRLDFQGDGVDDWSQSYPPDGVTYIYRSAGTYQSTFTVVDDDGDTGQARTTIEVERQPVSMIAFQSERSGNDDIWVMYLDGTGLVNVSRHGAIDSRPSVSADGSKVAWVSNRDGNWEVNDGNWEVYVANTDGTGLVNVSRSDAQEAYPSLSADGSKVAWLSGRYRVHEVYVANTDGTGIVNVSSHGDDDDNPSLSADGSKVAWMSDRDGNYEVYVANTDGTGIVNVSNHSGRDEFPSLSADGSKVAWVSHRDQDVYGDDYGEVYVANTDGTGLVNVSSDGAWDRYPSLSADGSKVAWFSNRDGNNEVYAANTDGTGLVNVSSNGAEDMYPSLSVDGSKVAWHSYRDGNYDVYLANTDGTGIVNVSSDVAEDWYPSLQGN